MLDWSKIKNYYSDAAIMKVSMPCLSQTQMPLMDLHGPMEQ